MMRPMRKPKAPPALGEVVAGELAASSHRIARRLRRVTKKPSPGEVHELRRDLRRLGARLEIASVLVHSRRVKAAQRSVRRALSATGKLRDAHVQLDLLARLGPPGFDELERLVRRQIDRLEKRLLKHPPPDTQLRRRVRRVGPRLRRLPHDPASEEMLRWLLKAALIDRRRRADKFAQAAAADDRLMHAARIAGRRQSLFTKIVRGLISDPHLPAPVPAAHLSAMGERHDWDVLLHQIRKWEARGWCSAAQSRAAAEAIRQWRPAPSGQEGRSP
jgi:hypothetical protein